MTFSMLFNSTNRRRHCDELGPLDSVFAHLDRWRHLPNYQLERRADIFFSVYSWSVVDRCDSSCRSEHFGIDALGRNRLLERLVPSIRPTLSVARCARAS
jgi:hypothetical protein